MIKSLKIGDFTTENNLFVAPLAGFTDFAFRSICVSQGATAFTEMISAKALQMGNKKTIDMLYAPEKNPCVQIFGSEPLVMRYACESEYLKDFKIIDINMGCPAPKIYANKEGSYLLNDISLASKIISECKKSGKTITVKTRIGLVDDNPLIVDFAKMCEDSGADMITVHARSKSRIYSGDCNYKLVYEAKKNLNIPLIINGGIFTPEDYNRAMEQSGADGAMLARGALENPALISEILGKNPPSVKKLLFTQLDLLKTRYSDREISVKMRKTIAYYLKRVRGTKDIKIKIFSATGVDEIKSILSPLDF